MLLNIDNECTDCPPSRCRKDWRGCGLNIVIYPILRIRQSNKLPTPNRLKDNDLLLQYARMN